MRGHVAIGVISALGLTACEVSGAVAPDAGTRDATVVDTNEPRELPRSASFLITHLELQRGPDQGGEVIGLDLDGRVSAGDAMASDCRDRHPDRESPLGATGVDNQLVVGLVPMLLELVPDIDWENDLDQTIDSGESLHAIRVTELDDVANDPDVRVEVLVVARPGCTDAMCPPGEIHAGDVFVDRGTPIASDLAGAVVDGHLRFTMPRFAWISPTIPFDLADGVIDVAVDDDGLEGVIAGAYAIQTLLDLADQLMPSIMPPDHTMLRMHFQTFSDLLPSPEDASVCDAISTGMSVEATRIVVPERR